MGLSHSLSWLFAWLPLLKNMSRLFDLFRRETHSKPDSFYETSYNCQKVKCTQIPRATTMSHQKTSIRILPPGWERKFGFILESGFLLPITYVVRGKVILLLECVILFTGGKGVVSVHRVTLPLPGLFSLPDRVILTPSLPPDRETLSPPTFSGEVQWKKDQFRRDNPPILWLGLV